MTKLIIFFVFVCLDSLSWKALASESFCPRLEGTNLECFAPGPTGPVPSPTGIVCPVSEKSITCYSCASSSTITQAFFSDQCNSWTCQVETSPEGLPRKSAQCTSRSSCCSENTTSCCDSVNTTEGKQITNSDCSVQTVCSGGSPYQPSMCNGLGSRTCSGSPSCGSDAPAPSDCN